MHLSRLKILRQSGVGIGALDPGIKILLNRQDFFIIFSGAGENYNNSPAIPETAWISF